MKTKVVKLILMFLALSTKLLIAQESTPLSVFKTELKNEKRKEISYSKSFVADTILYPFKKVSSVTSIFINGQVKLFAKNSIVRITVADTKGTEYMLFESNYLTNDSLDIQLKDAFEETGILDSIVPNSLNVLILNAKLDISSIIYTDGFRDKDKKIRNLKSDLVKYKKEQKIIQINKRISELNLKWVAGETPISNMSYEEKKSLFGDTIPNLMGFDYYVGGLFEIPSDSTSVSSSTLKSSSTPVSEFDWRNRHGKNWNSSVKSQFSGTCWAFGAVGATEAIVNLYYNKKIDLDLSEGDVVACSGAGSCSGGSQGGGGALDYIASTGVVDQRCFANGNCSASCSDKCTSLSERIFIDGKITFNPSSYTDPETELKKFIVAYGVVSGRIGAWGHTMALSGFGTVEAGDVVYEGTTGGYSTPITIPSGDSRIGDTYWIFKNSWGSAWGEDGYAYVISDISQLVNTRILETPVTSLNYTVNDIVCEDRDGDGYYNWGIGSKPSTCPSCSLNEKDGDDSNSNYGPMDEYGNLESITPYTYPSTTVTTNQTWSGTVRLCGNLIVQSNATLTITGSLIMPNHSQILIQNGGKLNVNGGLIRNANVIVRTGCNLTLLNNAVLEKDFNDELTIDLGATFDFTFGEIKQLEE